ncbi:phospho-N-acetylmuramoyl-pentapeptide-transferase [Ponticaulis profundi]|uniref:Phospho-N-acetylmuramoyl-pentapeptide-transferase n=1 Tax=Ponticaulis profundi TaxID=2665222 RepID=A0ABW1S5H2_9PROT
MLYEILSSLAEKYTALNVMNYVTFRAGLAFATAFVLCLLIGAPMINWLRKRQKKGQPIREDGPESHLLTKKGTPTMGGFLILIGISIGTLLWADLSNEYVWIVLFVTVGYGLIGFLDDFTKVTKGHAGGLSGKARLGAEFVIAIVAVVWVTRYAPIAATESALLRESAGLLPVPIPEGFETSLTFPFFKDVLINLTIYGFAMFGSLVIVGAANSVNLTDGLDGLAIVPVMIAGGTFAIIAYICGTPRYAEYLYLINTPGTTELTVLFGALFGSGLGFLWYNAPPAKVFMGDTGSLALGGTVGSVAVCTKHEIVLAIVGGLFVLEALSVIVQVASFKLTGKRVFKMAPIHHHYEKLGWAESTVVIRFWIIAVVLALIGLATLKLR